MKFEDRKARLRSVVGDMPVADSCPLLYESKLRDEHVALLRNSVIYYVYVSLVHSFPSDSFELCAEFFDRYESRIASLMNITPNGLILPKQENCLAYHEVHVAVATVLDCYNFGDKVRLIHTPINIRLVRSGPNDAIASSRQKASTKLHSDIWAGEFASSLMVFIPLSGDIENIGVDFYEPPAEFYPEYVTILDDYSDGAHFLEKSDKYACALKNGHLYLIDPFLLHKTFKRSMGWRLSLDLRFIPYEELESDLKISTKRDENYIPYEDWKSFGRTRLLFTAMSIGEYDQTRDRNAYAGGYETVMLRK